MSLRSLKPEEQRKWRFTEEELLGMASEELKHQDLIVHIRGEYFRGQLAYHGDWDNTCMGIGVSKSGHPYPTRFKLQGVIANTRARNLDNARSLRPIEIQDVHGNPIDFRNDMILAQKDMIMCTCGEAWPDKDYDGRLYSSASHRTVGDKFIPVGWEGMFSRYKCLECKKLFEVDWLHWHGPEELMTDKPTLGNPR